MITQIDLTFYYVDVQYHFLPLPLSSDFNITNPELSSWQGIVQKVCESAASLSSSDLTIQPVSTVKDPKDKAPRVHVLLVTPEQLADHAFLDHLPRNDLRKVIPPVQRLKTAELVYHPIITISFEDLPFLVADYSESAAGNISQLTFDPRVSIMDSGIWHRYVPELPASSTFEKILKETLQDICSYWQDGLYYTVAAVSTLEFQLRMLRHSFIGKFGKGGHEAVVTPFKFHSERFLKKEYDKDCDFFLEDWNGKTLIEALKWRVLVVDDYALRSISTVKGQSEKTIEKVSLLRRPIDRLYQKIGWDTTGADTKYEEHFKMDAPESKKGIVDYALAQLETTSFDLIFLDYLLGVKPDDPAREYGDSFLQRLVLDNRKKAVDNRGEILDNREKAVQYRRDFQGKYWIFPISSFPFALPDRLTQVGISHLHSIWHLSQGSDPITTPHAYSYFLLRFMKQKVREYFLDPRALELIFNEVPERLNPEDVESRKRWAGYLRDALQQYESKMNLLKRQKFDNDHDSLFSQSILDFVEGQTYIISLVKNFKRICEEVIALNGGLKKSTLEGVKAELEKTHYDPHKTIISSFFNSVSKFELPDLSTVSAVKVYIAYAFGEEAYVDDLIRNCTAIRQQYDIEMWHAGLQLAGDPALEIEQRFNEAHIYIFLLTSELVGDSEIFENQLPRAYKKSQAGIPQAVLIPVKVLPVDIEYTQLSKLQALPQNDKLVLADTGYWLEVTRGIRRIIEERFPNIGLIP